jgi:hypothetical protein
MTEAVVPRRSHSREPDHKGFKEWRLLPVSLFQLIIFKFCLLDAALYQKSVDRFNRESTLSAISIMSGNTFRLVGAIATFTGFCV